jgi:light-regulated signal transduction histidine kinase (bacteriophytochrome)
LPICCKKNIKNQIDEAADHYLDFIISSASHMHEVIEALLRYSRVGNKSDHFELVDLNNVLQTTLDNLSIEIDENQAQIESQDLPTVKGDKISLVQLFQNLISNAIKFKSDRPPLIKFDCKKTESVWQFKCTDNGIGIDEIYQDKIFFPFQRLEDQPQSGTRDWTRLFAKKSLLSITVPYGLRKTRTEVLYSFSNYQLPPIKFGNPDPNLRLSPLFHLN